MSTKNICPVASPPETKFATLARDLRLQIVSGALLPGCKLPSYPAMQERGVSQPVLDRAYALLESEGLIERRRRSGVFVARLSAPAPRQKTGVLGIPGLPGGHSDSTYFLALFNGMRAEADRQGYDLLVCRDMHPDRLAKMDGVIWTMANYELPLKVLPPTMPWVSALWLVPDVPSITADEGDGIRQAVQHLLSLGHTKIAYLAIEWADWLRRAAYREALQDAGVTPDPHWERLLYRDRDVDLDLGFYGYGHRVMGQWLQENWHALGCTAVLAHNDQVAAGAMRAVREAGLRTPQDISVVGFDGTAFAHYTEPRLTTVEVPLREAGARSVESLIQLLNGQPVGSQVLPVRLQVGESSGPSRA